MTRTTIGGIAAGAFTLGLLAGIVVPSALDVSRHDWSMATHRSAMGDMPAMGMGAMPMGMGSNRAMPMGMGAMPMGMGAMPMGMGSNRAMHEAHHGSPEVAR